MSELRFPSDRLDVPRLDLSWAASGVALPLLRWGHREKHARENVGSFHHYVDDYRFQGHWKDPDLLISTGCTGILEVNYSLFPQSPFPLVLWSTYRKRWLASYWAAEGGCSVWVDVNVPEEWTQTNLLGVPEGWPSYATRGYASRLDDLEREYSMAENHWQAGQTEQMNSPEQVTRGGVTRRVEELAPGYNSQRTPPLRFLVVNGGAKVRELCATRGWIYMEDVKENRHE